MPLLLDPLPESFAPTRDALQVIAVHVLARARHGATGRVGLRPTPGGFGTPAFGSSVERLRISGAHLVREVAGEHGASTASIAIHGATLAELARFAGVDLSGSFSVGHDTPQLGDADIPLQIDEASAVLIGNWFTFVAGVLDDVAAATRAQADLTVAQLWPEHFDLAFDLAAAPERRVNIGGSPGDAYSPSPYLYVGPWTADRPGDATYWNAPFGAVLPYETLTAGGDARARAAAFIGSGLRALTAA